MPDSQKVQRIDIFISSPGDLATERTIVKSVIERLRRKPRLREHFTFEALAYEDWTPASVGTTPQTTVNEYMKFPHDTQMFICLFWHRMGTPVSIDGVDYESGTHYEFMDAYQSNQSTGYPLILLYRCQKQFPITHNQAQLEQVDAFFQKFHGSNAELRGVYKQFTTDDEFERILTDDLEAVIARHFDIRNTSTDQLSWIEISNITSLYTQKMLGIRYREKYEQKYYSPRPDIQKHFEAFLSSDKTAMIIIGKAGTGKSSFISDISTQTYRKDMLVLLQDCAILQLEDDESLDNYFHRQLKLPHSTTFLQVLNGALYEQPDQSLLILFDAVNENSNPSHLLRLLSDFVMRVSSSQIKILITCRIPAWNTLRRFLELPIAKEYHVAGPNSYITFSDTFDDKEMPEIYEKYRLRFRLPTMFADLAPSVKEFITQPLFLKLMSVAYEGEGIPKQLSVEDILNRYINRCLGLDLESDFTKMSKTLTPNAPNELQILKATIQLMYERARRELDLSYLRQDDKVGSFISTDLTSQTAYTNLVNDGLLSQRIDHAFAQKIEVVFVTYERVFEFLLFKFQILPVNLQAIQEALDLSKRKSFLQLRGAAELAMSFETIRGNVKKEQIIALAKSDSPEIRQFLIDSIQTIYSAGHRKLTENIINDLSRVNSERGLKDDPQERAANQLAVQAAFQIKLDVYLIRFAMSQKPFMRELASLFIYQRWNKARLDGHLHDGYQIIRDLADKVKIFPIPGISTPQALSALVTISINLLSHIIDDPVSLMPLVQIWQNIIRQIPGLDPRPSNAPLSAAAKIIMNTLIDIFAKIITPLMKKAALGDDSLLRELWNDKQSQRAFLDASILYSVESLNDHEAKVHRLLVWKHQLVPYMLMGTIIHHVYLQPEAHTDFIRKAFYELDLVGKQLFETRFALALSYTYGGLARTLRNMPLPVDFIGYLDAYIFNLWQMLQDGSSQEFELDDKNSKLIVSEARTTLKLIFTGIMHIEALLNIRQGRTDGSAFLLRFLEALDYNMNEDELKCIVESIEYISYLGFPEFAVLTFLSADFRRVWERDGEQNVLESLSHIRAFYQDEVDSLLSQDQDDSESLFTKVRLIGSIPDTNSVLAAIANLWLVSAAIEPAVTKMAGSFMGDLVLFSNSSTELIRALARTLIAALFDFDSINIMHYYWRTLHDPDWDGYEEWQIPRDIVLRNLTLNNYWSNVMGQLIRDYGRGILYNELDRDYK